MFVHPELTEGIPSNAKLICSREPLSGMSRLVTVAATPHMATASPTAGAAQDLALHASVADQSGADAALAIHHVALASDAYIDVLNHFANPKWIQARTANRS